MTEAVVKFELLSHDHHTLVSGNLYHQLPLLIPLGQSSGPIRGRGGRRRRRGRKGRRGRRRS